MPVRIQIDAWDVVAGATVVLRASSHDELDACHVGGETWWPTLAKLPTLRYDLFDGAFTGNISAPSSSLTMQTEPWPNFARYTLADARFQLWTGDAAGWAQRFDGRVSAQPKIDGATAAVDFGVDDRWLDRSLLQLYAGTGGAEGPAAMKGQTKPLAIGAPRYAPGKLIDSINSVFQVSAYGVQGFEAALEKAARFSASIGDFASYADLVGASIPAGRWASAKAVGMVRFGAPPTGLISLLLQGDNAGPNGWIRKPGQIIRRLALLAGGIGKIDDASLDALDAARPYNLSLCIGEQTTARQLIQSIAASVNAVAGVTWLGKLFVAPVALGAASVTLAADGSALPPVGAIRQIETGAPWRKLVIGAERTWAVHALSDIAFTAPLVELGDYAAGTTYREGNIVDQPDGSRWLYVNTTPSAGNAPPASTSTGNAYWSRYRKAFDLSQINDRIEALASDSILSRAEKPLAIIQYAALQSDLAAIEARYQALSAPADAASARGDANTAATALANYLQGLTPAWNDPAVDTPIDPQTYRTRWTTAYSAIATFAAAITGRPGQNGNPGAPGAPGAPGNPGLDGGPAYVHIAYADSPDGSVNFHKADPTGRTYFGVYSDGTALGSASPSAYTWSLIKGSDGANGAPGPPGIDGAPSYVHIAYANAADGSVDFSTTDPIGRHYIGVYTDGVVPDSTNPALYSWSLVKGADGAAGVDAVVLDASAASVTFQADYLGALKPNQLQQTVKFTVLRGGVDVSGSTTWSVEASGCAAAIGATGLVTFSGATASGYIRVHATQGGTVLPVKQVPTTFEKDAPPPSTDTAASARVTYELSATSYPSPPNGGTVITNVGSGGVLRGQLTATYDTNGTGNCTGEFLLAYRLAGTANAWTYFSAGAVIESQARSAGSAQEPILETGAVTINQTQSVSAGRYELGLFVRRYSGGQTAYGSGTLSAKDG